MSLGDRLGLAGLIVAFIGIAAMYLWPTQKWIGKLCVVMAIVLVLFWGKLELWPGRHREAKEPPTQEPPAQKANQKPSKDETTDKVEAKPNRHSTVKPTGISPEQAYSVAVEIKMMVPSPSKDVAGTGLWALSRTGANCYLLSVDTAMLIRIKNLRPTKVMVTAYNIYGLGGELHRIRMDMNDPFLVLQEGVIPRHFQGNVVFPMPVPSGNGGGGFFQVPLKGSDFSAAATVQSPLLDREIGEHYIEPGDNVRGWAFFEYHSVASMPMMLTMKISDDTGQTFSYRIPDEAGNSSGDTLKRVLIFGPTVDLSSCIRQPHTAQSQQD